MYIYLNKIWSSDNTSSSILAKLPQFPSRFILSGKPFFFTSTPDINVPPQLHFTLSKFNLQELESFCKDEIKRAVLKYRKKRKFWLYTWSFTICSLANSSIMFSLKLGFTRSLAICSLANFETYAVIDECWKVKKKKKNLWFTRSKLITFFLVFTYVPVDLISWLKKRICHFQLLRKLKNFNSKVTGSKLLTI